MSGLFSFDLLNEAVERLEAGFASLPEFEPSLDTSRMREVLLETAERLHDNYPYHHPLYMGQMLKPPHPVARVAYALAMTLNPNNHALDGGRASSAMEREVVADLAGMFGWRDRHLGHLTGGGTMANLEALWIAWETHPGKTVVASDQAHYTHRRVASVLGVPFDVVPVDGRGRMDPAALRARLQRGDVGTVVATLGATATGAVDPLPEILALAAQSVTRVHVDAAYGGYFILAGNLEPETRVAFDAITHADSVVIDPHKHGLQPYGCGCILYRDPAVGRHYKHDSTYTYFTSGDLHMGEISLECSRPGAAAVALWATHRMLPPVPSGEFARGLERGRDAALALHDRLTGSPGFSPLLSPELDIVVWAVKAASSSAASRRAREVFDAAARRGLHLALATFPRLLVEPALPDLDWDGETVACLRACVMKPTHRDWLDELWSRIEAAGVRGSGDDA